MEKEKSFNGSIVIADPCYFVGSEEDWQKCDYGKRMDLLGFSDFLLIEFPDDIQVVIDSDTKEVLGGLCQDSCQLVVIYKDELKKYRNDYEKAFWTPENRAIIDDFIGKVGYRVEEVAVDDEIYEDTIVYGDGNRNFRSYDRHDERIAAIIHGTTI
ncbi:MAG: hypothetical protein K6B69_07290 [Lachnospiraceae bacterium]|nr:hypothetical protein [Lachnospiraceae bacterium]